MRVQISNHKFKHILATITFVIISMLILQLTNAYPSIEGSFGREKRASGQLLVNVIEALAELDFTADATYGDFPLVVSFESNIDPGEDASFLWDFGDGVKSRLPTPTHAYTNPGQYDVELFVKNNSQTIAYVKKEAFITVVEEPPGTLYYVSPSGDNSNNGSSGNPWRDIWYGAKQLTPGDTLVVHGGTYRLSDNYDEGFEIAPNSGSESGGWVKIRSAINESVILKGSELVENGNENGFDLTDKQYIAIQEIAIDGEGPPESDANIRLGIWYENCHHIALIEMNIHHISEEGIKGNTAHHMLMEKVTITYSCFSAFDCGINDQPEYGVDEFTIRECDFSYSGEGGWNNPQERADAVACEISEGTMYIEYSTAIGNSGDGWDCKIKNVYIYNCITGENLNNIKVWQNAVIENCVAYNHDYDTDWDSVFFDCGVSGSKIVFCNNLIYKGKNYALCAGYDYPGVTCYITFYNNIIVQSDGPAFFQDGHVVEEDYNLFYQNQEGDHSLEIGGISYSDEDINNGLAGAHDKAFDPKFIDSENSNFHLSESSPAINAGADFFVGGIARHIVSDFDLEDKQKVNQKDIGPYEFLVEETTTTPVPTTTPPPPTSSPSPTPPTATAVGFITITTTSSILSVIFYKKKKR